MDVSKWMIAVLGLAIGLACASVQPPGDAISRAQVAIRKADEAGASQYASLELLKAREKVARAEEAARDDDTWDEARRLAEQAAVDAELAEEKARSQRAQANAKEMQRSIESLRAEISRLQDKE